MWLLAAILIARVAGMAVKAAHLGTAFQRGRGMTNGRNPGTNDSLDK
jgi:hypothetical protein